MAVRIKECKLGRLGSIGFVFRILQQQPEYEERRSSCAEQESSLSSLAATRQHVFLPPSALLSRHFFLFHFSVTSAKMANAMDADK